MSIALSLYVRRFASFRGVAVDASEMGRLVCVCCVLVSDLFLFEELHSSRKTLGSKLAIDIDMHPWREIYEHAETCTYNDYVWIAFLFVELL